jgi:thiamine biosynthesis lipoprotein
MKFYKAFQNILPLLAVAALLTWSCKQKQEYKTIDGFTQGTTYHIVYEQPGKDTLNALVDSLLLSIDNSLSVYNDSSLISRINRNESVMPDTLFINVFNRSREIWDLSSGSFDISAAPFFEVWGFGAGEKRDVTQKMVDSIRQFVGMDKISLAEGKIVKSDPRVSLNVNAIAQGYTADVIAYAFDRLGIDNYLVEVGGEIFCKGVNAKGLEWSVGLDKPVEGNMIQGGELQEVISLSGRGLATSGNYRKFIEENGQKYSHTIDPKTGFPVKQSLLSATVVAADAMTADA